MVASIYIADLYWLWPIVIWRFVNRCPDLLTYSHRHTHTFKSLPWAGDQQIAAPKLDTCHVAGVASDLLQYANIVAHSLGHLNNKSDCRLLAKRTRTSRAARLARFSRWCCSPVHVQLSSVTIRYSRQWARELQWQMRMGHGQCVYSIHRTSTIDTLIRWTNDRYLRCTTSVMPQ